MSGFNKRLCGLLCMFSLLFFIQLSIAVGSTGKESRQLPKHNIQEGLRLSTFDIDVTPPIGMPLAYDVSINKWDLGLRAKGVVLQGAGLPIVLCAIDWLAIGNEGMDDFKRALAAAVGSIPERIAVNALHQHDAPRFDSGAEQILLEAGLDPAKINPSQYDGTFPREALRNLTVAVKSSLNETQPVTHLGLGKGTVDKVASNRNIYGPDGKVRVTRMSTTRDAKIRAEPEGVIDPELSLVSFWNEDQPIAIFSYYATHPQSYYRTGIPNPDFVGVARFFRQLAVPDALHVHFNGAGGNIAAGKYNDGSHENRLIFAQRLAAGMEEAWEATKKEPITSANVSWTVEKVALPPAPYLFNMQEKLKESNELLIENSGIARKMAWLRRTQEGKTIDLKCLSLNNARLLHMPGELFVEYQLAAKAARPDLYVAMAAYGDLGMGYIGTTLAYEKGGYEVSQRVSNVAPEVEGVLMKAIENLLKK
ncbi:hypothetical protein [Cyclobacterium marinum]|uniref:Neutral/alkaline non-lysosomal ceramidase N-terminal domain-containing protein n=1 Tax=Cyclobacterium marinum (strain ATCC 25205 / DSM 745 / LMG 13164 / NCIMB 1802) TaxID=880070 RepID=G0IYY8_CYCMS|nr:hypothetical protein [Cyclobacterium marinum]AEL28133.1 hypothetical protein Cycma_4431 [Cyclobacterium marinum DSM 745]